MGQQYEVVNNDWYTKGQPLNIQSNIEIFAPPLLAIKELLQGGTVEGGANADCLIKIYQDSQERKHLFIANSAETPADLHQMLNFGASEAETISSCNGVGIKTALSFFAPEEATKGKFVMATRGEHGMAYVTSPFTTSEPMNEYWETDDGYQWPLEVELGDNYRTCIDTVIENFDSYEQDLNAKNLEEYMGVIFGFRIKDYGLNLRIETEEETIEHVKVNLPEILNAVEELYERKNKDDVALTVHHEQHFSIEKTEKKDGKTYTAHLDIQANNGVVDKEEKGFWRRRTLTQGAWLVQDGVLQTYIGPKLFDLAPHNSMNGMYTFLDVSSQDGATLKYDTPQFDPSKTSMNARGGLYQSIKQYFGKAEPERVNAQDERYQDYNSIRASYKWNKESFTEKRMRAFMDKALSVYALQRNAVEGNNIVPKVQELLQDNDFFIALKDAYERNGSMALMTQVSIQQIAYIESNGCLCMNKNPMDRKDLVQRNIVTTIETMSRIVMSAINGDHAFGVIDLQVDFDGMYACADDGMQRLTALLSFLRGDFAITDTGTILDGYYFADLPIELKEAFKHREIDVRVVAMMDSSRRAHRFETLNSHKALTNDEKLVALFNEDELVKMAIEIGNNEPSVRDLLAGENTDNVRFMITVRLLLAAILLVHNYGNSGASIANCVKAFLEQATAEERVEVMEILKKSKEISIVSKRIGSEYLGKKFVPINRRTRDVPPINDSSDEALKRIFGVDGEPFIPSQRTFTNTMMAGYALPLFALTANHLEEFDSLTLKDRQSFARRIDVLMASDEFRDSQIDHGGARKLSSTLEFLEAEFVNFIERTK